MDAVEFLKQLKRRSKSNPDYYGEELSIAYIDPESLVAQVKSWAKENPIKTHQSVLLEQWPEAALDEEGVLSLCPTAVSAKHRSASGGCATMCRSCVECRHDYWLQEVK